ncbi:MAG: phosphoribosylamine--glycine ligase [Thermoplasmata archaeon]|nr:phosphoribosylamine--glycine ligase [Thermoplasmata archaeon]
MRVLVVGGGAREHAIAWGLARSQADVVAVCAQPHPGLDRIAKASLRADPADPAAVVKFAKAQGVRFAVIGPEGPLAAGVADALRTAEVPVVGPSKAGAQIETSKRFCRELMEKHGVHASPRYVSISSPAEVDPAVREFVGPFVVKPVGLTSGKGVWVQGRDFQAPEEGGAYARQLLSGGGSVLLEERMEGEEFSLMAFVTDSGVYPMPVVQDYKRAGVGDEGPNTGGMGSYSQRDHLLPFLSQSHRDAALDVVQRTVQALRAEGIPYRGILYGGFMLTARGPLLIEFNARFGDPEGINALTLYEEGNLAGLLEGVANGRVDRSFLQFRQRATVVKYLAPPGYPLTPSAGGVLELDEPAIEALGVRVLYANVEPAGAGRVKMSTSRAVALVGEASAITEASHRVDAAVARVKGTFTWRPDVGSREDVQRRTEHMRRLLSPGAKPSPLPLSVARPDAPASSAGSLDQVMGPA